MQTPCSGEYTALLLPNRRTDGSVPANWEKLGQTGGSRYKSCREPVLHTPLG